MAPPHSLALTVASLPWAASACWGSWNEAHFESPRVWCCGYSNGYPCAIAGSPCRDSKGCCCCPDPLSRDRYLGWWGGMPGLGLLLVSGLGEGAAPPGWEVWPNMAVRPARGKARISADFFQNGSPMTKDCHWTLCSRRHQ